MTLNSIQPMGEAVHAMTLQLNTDNSRIGQLLDTIEGDIATDAELQVMAERDKERMKRLDDLTLKALVAGARIQRSKAKVRALRRGK